MNRTPGRRARAPASGTEQQRHHHRATPAANTRQVNTQAPLFGPPVAQRAASSVEQIALKRQRLTTTYDPLSPPEDDATTAEGVRMGVVTDQDGRHWRQQTMRLGRWVTHWKDTYPFAAQPVDVEDLTKAEKYWLDIKFRRRILQRKIPIKKAAGRGCTGSYWASRRGNRGVLSGRVGKASGHPSSATGAGRDDDPVSAGDDQGGLFEQSTDSLFKPSSDNATSSVDPLFKDPLLHQVLAHHGMNDIESKTLGTQLRGLLPDDLFTNVVSYPKLEGVPAQSLTAISDILRASGYVPQASTASKDTKPSPRREEDRQQVGSKAQARRQFESDILHSTGLGNRQSLPVTFWDSLDKSLQGLQDSGQGFSADFRAQVAAAATTAAAASAAASGGTGNVGNTGSKTGPGAGLGINFGTGHGTGQQHRPTQSCSSGRRPAAFISAAQAAADQNRYWAVSDSGESLIPRPTNDPGHRQCSKDQLQRIMVQDGDDLSLGHAWVEMQQVDDKAFVYVRDDRTEWYIPLDRALTDTPRLVNLRLSNSTELAVDESQVGTAPEHIGAVILNCDPLVNDFEWASERLVTVQQAGIVQRVPDNKLGAYLGGVVNPPGALKKKVPMAPGRTIALRQSDGVVMTVPVSEVDNFQHGGTTIALDSTPPANVDEETSERKVWVNLGPAAAGSQTAEVLDNQLGLFKGLTISQPRPIHPYRIVRLKETSRTAKSVYASELSNWRHQGRVIVDTAPRYNSLETPSTRLIHISTRPDMVDMSVPDNQLGRYPGAVIRAPPQSDSETQEPKVLEQVPIHRDQLVVLKLPAGGPEIRIPVSSASSAHYLGAMIVRTIPDDDRNEPPSKTTVHVSDDGAHFDVPDNGLGRYRGWVISTPPNLTERTPEKRQTGIRKGDSTLDREGRARNSSERTSSQSRTSSKASAFMKRQAPGGGKPFAQGEAAAQTEADSHEKESTQGDASAEGEATPQSKAVVQPTPPSTRSKATAQSKAGIQSEAAPQVKATTQPTPPSTQGKAATQGKTAAQVKAITQPAPPFTQADAAPVDSSGWETNVDYPTSIQAPEFISPTKRDFPNGRPDKDGNLPQPRAPRVPRGAPHELKRLQQIRDRLNRLNRKDALRQHLVARPQTDTNTSSGSGASTRATNFGSVVGAVTVRAGSTPASSVDPQRSMIRGASRANIRPGTAAAPPVTEAPVAEKTPTTTATMTRTTTPKPTTPKPTTTATKSGRVEKRSGTGARTGRNVRFGPLPTEADTGRDRREGLRTRKQRKSGKGVGN